MANIDMIQFSRSPREMRAPKTAVGSRKTDFLELLKGNGQLLKAKEQAASETETEKTGISRREQNSNGQGLEWEGDEAVPADAMLMLALNQLTENQIQISGRPEVAAASADEPVTAAAPEPVVAEDTQAPVEAGDSGEAVVAADFEVDTEVPPHSGKKDITPTLPQDTEPVKETKHSDNQADAAVSMENGNRVDVSHHEERGGPEPEAVARQVQPERRDSRPVRKEAAEETVYTDIGQVSENPLAGRAPDIRQPSEAVPVRTTPETLPEDVGKAIAAHLPERDGEMTIELEPASLGKMTIRVIYEEGRAAVSILTSNPKTLELLSQKAGEIAQILEERTGQQTVVYTPEPQQEPDGRQGGQEHGEERQNHNPQKQQNRHQPDSFVQQLRLGLV